MKFNIILFAFLVVACQPKIIDNSQSQNQETNAEDDGLSEWERNWRKNLQTDFGQMTFYKKANEELTLKGIKPKVVFLGNSITEGWVNVDSAFFASNNFVGRGIGGQTSPQLLVRFRQDVIDLKPEVVVIHIGTNDIAENTGPYKQEFTLSNIEGMVEMAQANNIKVVLASVVPTTVFAWREALGNCAQKILDLNEGVLALSKKYNTHYADYHSALKNSENGMDKVYAEDGVHPTKEGYEVMKEVIQSELKKLGQL